MQAQCVAAAPQAPEVPDALVAGAHGRVLLVLPSSLQAAMPSASQLPSAFPLLESHAMRVTWSSAAWSANGNAWCAVDSARRVICAKYPVGEPRMVESDEAWPHIGATCVGASATMDNCFAVGGTAGVAVLTIVDQGMYSKLLQMATPTVAVPAPKEIVILPHAKTSEKVPQALSNPYIVHSLAWHGDHLLLGHAHTRVTLLHCSPHAIASPPHVLSHLALHNGSCFPSPPVNLIRWHPSGTLIALCASTDVHLVGVQLAHGASALVVTQSLRNAHAAPVTGLAWNGDGSLLCSAALDGAVKGWAHETYTGTYTATVFMNPSMERPVWGLALSPLSTQLMCVTAQAPNRKQVMYGSRVATAKLLALPLTRPTRLACLPPPSVVAWEVALMPTDSAAHLASLLDHNAAPSSASWQLSALLHAHAGNMPLALASQQHARALAWHAALAHVMSDKSLMAGLTVAECASLLRIASCLRLPLSTLPHQPISAPMEASENVDEAKCQRGHRTPRCMRTSLVLAASGNLYCHLCQRYTLPLTHTASMPFFSALLTASPGCVFCAATLQPV